MSRAFLCVKASTSAADKLVAPLRGRYVAVCVRLTRVSAAVGGPTVRNNLSERLTRHDAVAFLLFEPSRTMFAQY